MQRIKVGYGADGSYTDQDAKIATETTLATLLTQSDYDTKAGSLTEAAPASDTASSGLNGRLQRIAQRLTSLIALVPSALTGSGNFKTALQEAIPAGTNAIGKLAANSGVDIGDVDVTSVPADPFGANADAAVAAGATGSIQAKLRRVTQGLEDLKTLIVLAAGTAVIGKVGIDQTTPGTTNKVDTELPDAVTTTDGTAYPSTAVQVGALIFGKAFGNYYAVPVQSAGDGIGDPGGDLSTVNRALLYNSATWDVQRNNIDVTLLSSAARTATIASTDQTNHNGRRLLLIVNVSSAGTGSITPTLQYKDSISGNYVTVWTAAAALTANGTYAYYFSDGGTDGSFTEDQPFGLAARTWRLNMVANNANSMTYSTSGVTGV